MRLTNRSKEEQRVLDAGDGFGRAVAPGVEADFTDQCARELLASFPSVWGTAPVTPLALEAVPVTKFQSKKEGAL